MAGSPKVIVVGSGVVGLSVAHYAAREGLEVQVIDREPEGFRNASWGNAGMIVPSHFEPLAAPGMVGMGVRMMLSRESPFSFSLSPSRDLLRWAYRFWRAGTKAHVERCAPVLAHMHLASKALFEDLDKELPGGIGLESSGMTMLCATEDGLRAERHVAEAAARFGVRAHALNGEEAQERQPNLKVTALGAVHYPDDANLTPGLVLDGLRARLKEMGVAFAFGTQVSGLRLESAKVRAIQTDRGELEADEFVICGGAWSAGLAGQVGIDLPVVAGKGYSMTLPDPPELPVGGLLLKEARVAVTGMADGLRFGGTMEIGKPDSKINAAKIAGIQRSVRRYLPAYPPAAFQGVEVWSGNRPISADGMPFLGRTKRLPNLLFATGHGMMGLSLGPISGKLVAQLLTHQRPEIPLDLMDPERYA